MTAVAYVAAYALLSTAGVLLLRASLRRVDELSGPTVQVLLLEPRFLTGLALYVLSFGTWLLALHKYEVGKIFPIFVAASFCGVVLGGYFLLGEALTASRLAGTVVVLVGIVLLLR